MRNPLWPMVLIFSFACGGADNPAPTLAKKVSHPSPAYGPLAEEAAKGVEDGTLATLLRDHWEWRMRESPTWATTLGDHRFDDQLGDSSHEAAKRGRKERDLYLTRARKLTGLNDTDRITTDLFIGSLEASTAADVCETHLWGVSPRGNAATSFNKLPEHHKHDTKEGAESLLARYQQMAPSIRAQAANLKLGAEKGLYSNRESVVRTIRQVEGELKKPLSEWPLYRPVVNLQASQPAIAAGMTKALESDIRPAVKEYLATLKAIEPKARGPKEAGLSAMPNGKECYQARIKLFIGLDKTAQELHDIGVREIEKINGEMRTLGYKLFKTRNLKKILKRLRTDKKLYFTKREDVKRAAEVALEKARTAMPDYFGILPKAPVKVTEIPDYEAPFTTIAYYSGAHIDGTKPGEYFINTYKPEVRPRFEQEVLAYHEAIPGHHLQIAIAQERGELPMFRRHGGSTAFVEGWALYTERLSNEMGLYTGDLDRMGMLSYDAWRASRLVVDTGIHALGWTREQAETFMYEHTVLAKDNIVNEVDRYISWPGQALAYKVGQLEIFRLRAIAEKALGDRFSLKDFHDQVLMNGAVTLPVLEGQINRWLESRAGNGPS